MRIETYPEVLERHVEEAVPAAAAAVRDRAAARQRSRTGEYAASLVVTTARDGDRIVARVGSPLPQAGAVERGADVGSRRGPHMRGSGALRDAGREFPELMTRELRARSR